MKKVVFYLFIFIFIFILGISSVSALKLNVYGYKCLTVSCSSSTNVLTKLCLSDTCTIPSFTASNYCNAASLGEIFRYRVSATNTVAQNIFNMPGSNVDKAKGGLAFTCGGCYIDKDGDKWGVGPIIYQDVTYGCPSGYVIWTAYKGQDVYDNNPAYTSTGPIWVDMNGNPVSSVTAGGMVELKGQEQSGYKIYNNKNILITNLTSDANGVVYWNTPKNNAVYYFTTNTTGQLKSNLLNVSSDIPVSPIDVKLVSPICGSHFDMGSSIDIKIDAKDRDDIINGSIIINGNKIKEFHNGNIGFKKLMNKSGDFRIVINSTNNHGGRNREISNIMILNKKDGKYVDGKYVAACIDEPKNYANIQGSIVNFDASTSRGVNVENGILHEIIPGTGKLSWYWIFMPEGIKRNYINTTQQIAYKFTAEFPTAGHNSAILKVDI